MKQFITEQTVSEITRLKLPTLRNHRHLRKGIPYIKIGRSVRYDPSDVEAYMQKHRIDPETVADQCSPEVSVSRSRISSLSRE